MPEGVQQWLKYREDAFGVALDVWNSGANFAQLRERWKADPQLVESLLVSGLSARDPLAADALAYLPLNSSSRDCFEQILLACLGAETVGFHLSAVAALHALTGDESWSREAVRVLLGAGFWGDRMEAARALGRFQPTCVLIEALSRAIEDPDFLVRHQAASTLLKFSGRATDITAQRGLFDQIRSGSKPTDWVNASLELAARATDRVESH
jgi:HEAT repeat protein